MRRAANSHATVYTAPDRPTVVSQRRVATNHQHIVEWQEFASETASLEREQLLESQLDDPGETVDEFIGRFLEPPVYASWQNRGWGTLYTAVYDPRLRAASYRWPPVRVDQSLDQFHEMELPVLTGATQPFSPHSLELPAG